MLSSFARRALPRATATQRPRFYADAIATAVTVNLSTPHSSLLKEKQATLVTMPGSAGYFGVVPGHVQAVAELKPGLVSVTSTQGNVEHYFVSGGFAFVHPNSVVDVSVLEAVPVEQLDATRVKSGLETFQKKKASAPNEVEAAKAQIGLDVHQAMTYALTFAQQR